MTYNYFNSGRLALGKKITAAFNSLNELLNAATEHVETTTATLSYYSQFMGKNFQAPEPLTGNMLVRTDEIFDLLTDTYFIRKFKVEGGKLKIDAVVFSNDYNRITHAIGETTKTSGYAIVKLSTSLESFDKTIRFSDSDDATTGEKMLFSFTRTGNTVHITNANKIEGCMIGETMHYKSISISQVATNTYTVKDKAECIMIHSNTTDYCMMKLNGTPILNVGSLQYTGCGLILYLKAGDKLDCLNSTIYRIYYNSEKL